MRQRVSSGSRIRFTVFKKIISAVTSFAFLCSTTVAPFAQQIIIDPTAPAGNQAILGSSGGGVPQVDIVTPQSGVSHNKFDTFNVTGDGLILNNSATGGTSITGGAVSANPNLGTSGPATVILNEVTGTGQSLMTGTTEIFGGKAAVIVANPNGIGCNGCSFINSDRTTLTTGVPTVTNGAVGLNVTRGTVTVGPDGHTTDGHGELVGRHVIIGGAVDAAGDLTVSGGSQQFDHSTGTTQAAPILTAKEHPYAVDATQFGSMNAGQIRVHGNESGLGVNVQGTMNATGDVTLTSNGDLFYRDIQSGGAGRIDGQGAVRQYGDATFSGDVDVSGNSITVYQGRVLDSGGDVSLDAQDFIVIAGEVSANAITINSATSITNSGFVLADDAVLVIATDSFLNQREIAAEYDIYYDPAIQQYLQTYQDMLLSGGEGADLAAEMLQRAAAHEVLNEYILQGASVAGADVEIQSGSDLTNLGGAIASTGDIRLLSGASIINEYVATRHLLTEDDGCPDTDCGYRVEYHAAEVLAGGDLTLTAQLNVENNGGAFAAAGNITAMAGQDIVNTLIASDHMARHQYEEVVVTSSVVAVTNWVGKDGGASYTTYETVYNEKSYDIDVRHWDLTLAPAKFVTLHGDIILYSERDFVSIGSEVSAGGSVTAEALGKVIMAGFTGLRENYVGRTHSYNESIPCVDKYCGMWGNNQSVEVTNTQKNWETEVVSSAATFLGLNIQIRAQGDISMSGARMFAQQDLQIASETGSILLDSADLPIVERNSGTYQTRNGFNVLAVLNGTEELPDMSYTEGTLGGDGVEFVELEADAVAQILGSNALSLDYVQFLQTAELLTSVDALSRMASGSEIHDAARSVGAQTYATLFEGGQTVDELTSAVNAALAAAKNAIDTDLADLDARIGTYLADVDQQIATIMNRGTLTDAELDSLVEAEEDSAVAAYDVAAAAALQTYEDTLDYNEDTYRVRKSRQVAHQSYCYCKMDYWTTTYTTEYYWEESDAKEPADAAALSDYEAAIAAAVLDRDLAIASAEAEILAQHSDAGIAQDVAAVQAAADQQMAVFASERSTINADLHAEIASASETLVAIADYEAQLADVADNAVAKDSVTEGKPSLAAALSDQGFAELPQIIGTRAALVDVDNRQTAYLASVDQQIETVNARIGVVLTEDELDDMVDAERAAANDAFEAAEQAAKDLYNEQKAHFAVIYEDDDDAYDDAKDAAKAVRDATIDAAEDEKDERRANAEDTILFRYTTEGIAQDLADIETSKIAQVAAFDAERDTLNQAAAGGLANAVPVLKALGTGTPSTDAAEQQDHDDFIRSTAWRFSVAGALGQLESTSRSTLYGQRDTALTAQNDIYVVGASSVVAGNDLSLVAGRRVGLLGAINTDFRLNDLSHEAFPIIGELLQDGTLARDAYVEEVEDGAAGEDADRYLEFAEDTADYHLATASLVSGRDMTVSSGGDVLNFGGGIVATDNLIVGAEGDIRNEALRQNFTLTSEHGCVSLACGGQGHDYRPAEILSGSTILMNSGGSIHNVGGTISAAAHVMLDAEQDIVNDALTSQYLYYYVSTSSFFGLKREQKRLKRAIIQEGAIYTEFGDMQLTAGNDIINRASLFSSGAGVILEAGRDILMEAKSEELKNYYKKSGFGFFYYASDTVKWNEFSTALAQVEGYSVNASAGRNLTGIGAVIMASDNIKLDAEEDINFDAFQNDKYLERSGWSIGITFAGSNILAAALEGDLDGTIEAYIGSNPALAAVHQLSQADSGWGTANGLLNVGYHVVGFLADVNSAAKVAGGGTNLAEAFAKNLNPFDGLSLDNFIPSSGSFLEGITFRFGMYKSRQDWTESHISQIVAGNDLWLSSGLDLVLAGGTVASASRDLIVDAGNDLLVTALADKQSSSSSSWGVSFGLVPEGFAVGVDFSKSRSSAKMFTNASLTAGENLYAWSGRDMVFAGANVQAGSVGSNGADISQDNEDDSNWNGYNEDEEEEEVVEEEVVEEVEPDLTRGNIYLDVGRNLVVESRQNISSSESYGFDFKVTFTGGMPTGFSGSYNYADADRKYTDEPTTIVAENALDIYVGEGTYLLGSLLESKTGMLSLDTGDFVFDNYEDTDHSESGGISVSVGLNQSWDASGYFNYSNEEGITFATVGEGTINVRNRPTQDIAKLNRNVEDMQVVTKRTEFSITVPGINLSAFLDDLEAAGNTLRALTADIPENIRLEGEVSVRIYQRMILNGVSVADARALSTSQQFRNYVQTQHNVDKAIAEFGSWDAVPEYIKMAAVDNHVILLGSASSYEGGSVLVPCDTEGTRCEVAFEIYKTLLETEQKVEELAERFQDYLSFELDSLSGYGVDGAKHLLFQFLIYCAIEDPNTFNDFVSLDGNEEIVRELGIKYGAQGESSLLNIAETIRGGGTYTQIKASYDLNIDEDVRYWAAVEAGIIGEVQGWYDFAQLALVMIDPTAIEEKAEAAEAMARIAQHIYENFDDYKEQLGDDAEQWLDDYLNGDPTAQAQAHVQIASTFIPVAGWVGKGSKAYKFVKTISPSKIDEIVSTPKGKRPDPSSYMSQSDIDLHLGKFDDGAVRFTSRNAVDKYGGAGNSEAFVLPKSEFDRIVSEAGGDLRVVEQRLGFDEGYLSSSDTMAVHITRQDLVDLRIPSGNEGGANRHWLPGGYTSGGVPEAVADLTSTPFTEIPF